MRLGSSHGASAAQAGAERPDTKIRSESGARRLEGRTAPIQSEFACSVCCSAQFAKPSARQTNSFDNTENEVAGATDKEIEDIFDGSEPESEVVETNEAIARRERRSY